MRRPAATTGPATHLRFSNVTTSSITARWRPPAAVPDWPILGYRVRVDGGSLSWTTSPTFTVSSLSPGTVHNLEIYVVNDSGSSTPLTGTCSTRRIRPSITLTGRLETNRHGLRVVVTGVAQGLTEVTLFAHMRRIGGRIFVDAGKIPVTRNGAFRWQHRVTGPVIVYVTTDSGVRSNRIIVR